jgi:hypothetical protein
MSQMSDYLEGQLRAHIFRTASFTKPTTLAIALCTAAPNDASTGATITEVSGGSYARVTRNPLDANWTAPDSTGGLTDNAAEIAFPQATANWGTITHIAILDSATLGAGNVLFHGALAASKVVNSGDTFKIPIGDLDVTLA